MFKVFAVVCVLAMAAQADARNGKGPLILCIPEQNCYAAAHRSIGEIRMALRQRNYCPLALEVK